MPPIRVLFICMGNICRSPMAEAVFRHLVAQANLSDSFVIDSSGTGDWHAGSPPHHGTLAVLRRNQIDPGDQRARQIRIADLSDFDYLVAMDEENLVDLKFLGVIAPQKVYRLLDFALDVDVRDVPDPFYTGGFDRVYELVIAGCAGLLRHIREERGL